MDTKHSSQPKPRRRAIRTAGTVAFLMAVIPLIGAVNATDAKAAAQNAISVLTNAEQLASLEAQTSVPTSTDALAAQAAQVPQAVTIMDDAEAGYRVDVVGDLAAAEDVAVLVPGASNSRETFDDSAAVVLGGAPQSPVTQAQSLYANVMARNADAHFAAIAWLQYTPPEGINIDALDTAPARIGAANLIKLQEIIPAEAHVTWDCHSYGSVVCATAAADGGADDIVLIGSPGTSFDSVAEMNTTATVWNLRADDDTIKYVALLSLIGLGLGPDPSSDGFGTAVITGMPDCGHSGYYTFGSKQLDALAAINGGLR